MVLAEAGLLGLAGAAGGIAAGLGLGWGVMQAMGTLRDAPLQVPWWGLAFSPTAGAGGDGGRGAPAGVARRACGADDRHPAAGDAGVGLVRARGAGGWVRRCWS